MSEPMDEDMTYESGEPSAAPKWRRIYSPLGYIAEGEDEEQLLSSMTKAFHLNFDLLSRDAQQVCIWFSANDNLADFREGLEGLLEHRELDEALVNSGDIRAIAIELFGDKYEYLKMLQQGYDLDPEPSQGAARTLQSVVTTTQTKKRTPVLRLRSSPADKAAERTTRTTSTASRPKRPVIPGFTISTRGQSGQSQPMTGSKEDSSKKQSRDTYNESWLRNWLKKRGFATTADLKLHPYKGWKIEAPKIQLIRAKNFLCDEDADRTIEWKTKFAELAEYFRYLLDNWQGEDWGYDLKQAIDMLHTHWVFENYHYGRPKLVLDFPNVWPKFSKRLPPVPGPKITMSVEDYPDTELLSERKLIHTEIDSAHDKYYRLASDKLYQCFIKEYEFDTRDYWGIEQFDGNGEVILRKDQPSSIAREQRPFNMNLEEDEAYINCMNMEMEGTVTSLQRTMFEVLDDEMMHFPDGVGATKEGQRTFVNFRGARRAALQQCLNKCNNFENSVTCDHWRALILPTPRLPEPDHGIVFKSAHLSYTPEKAARDPFAYTMALNWYKQSESYWAQWTRKHAIKEAYGHRLYKKRKEPPMDVPKNFMGPYYVDYMDMGMKKDWELLRRCQKLYQRIKRAAKRAPRQLLSDVLRLVEKGKAGVPWTDLNLKFHKNELMEDNDGGVVRLRPQEEEWLHFLGSDSITQQTLAVQDREASSPRSKLFEEKIQKLLQDLSPEAFFSDDQPKTLDGLMSELNGGGNARVRPCQFTEEEVIQELCNCAERGIIKLWYQLDGQPAVSRPDVDFHPEDRVQWLPSEDQTDQQGYDESGNNNDDVVSNTDTISTNVEVPPSEYFGSYTVGQPKLSDLRSWEECDRESDDAQATKRQTANFFRCLGYRLGDTLRTVEAIHRQNQAKLTPEQKKINLDFQEEINYLWYDDTLKRPNNLYKNPGQTNGIDRITPLYRDVIKIAEPEIYEEKWGGMSMMDDYINTTSDIVRKGVLREAYECKSLLFPTRIVRWTGRDGKTVEIPRREPVWSFGHPERRGVVRKQFWDINRWPLHLQSEKTMDRIQTEGPPKARAGDLPPPRSRSQPPVSQDRIEPQERVGPQESVEPQDRVEPIIVPDSPDMIVVDRSTTYAEHDADRRRFEPGSQEYWAGDTPLQRKAIEEHLRSRFETTEDPSWKDRFVGYWFKDGDKNKSPTLPEVDPRSIPKSRPRRPSSGGGGSPGDDPGDDPGDEPGPDSDEEPVLVPDEDSDAGPVGPEEELDEDVIMEEIPLPGTETPPPTPANPTHRRGGSSRAIRTRQTPSPSGRDISVPTTVQRIVPGGRSRRVGLELEDLEPPEVAEDERAEDEQFDFISPREWSD